MAFRTSDIPVLAELLGLVRGAVVLAIVDAVAHLGPGDAPVVLTGELTISTVLVLAVDLVGAVTAVVLVIAFPS